MNEKVNFCIFIVRRDVFTSRHVLKRCILLLKKTLVMAFLSLKVRKNCVSCFKIYFAAISNLARKSSLLKKEIEKKTSKFSEMILF